MAVMEKICFLLRKVHSVLQAGGVTTSLGNRLNTLRRQVPAEECWGDCLVGVLGQPRSPRLSQLYRSPLRVRNAF